MRDVLEVVRKRSKFDTGLANLIELCSLVNVAHVPGDFFEYSDSDATVLIPAWFARIAPIQRHVYFAHGGDWNTKLEGLVLADLGCADICAVPLAMLTETSMPFAPKSRAGFALVNVSTEPETLERFLPHVWPCLNRGGVINLHNWKYRSNKDVLARFAKSVATDVIWDFDKMRYCVKQ